MDKKSQQKYCVGCQDYIHVPNSSGSTPATHATASPRPHLMSTLESKMNYLTQQLEQPRLTFVEIRDITEAISKCADAIYSVQRLK
jgi:hypothetical protein